MTKGIGLPNNPAGSGENTNQGKWKNWLEQYGKYSKIVALLIAIIITYNILTNVDQILTTFSALKSTMLKLYVVVILVSYYLGGTPTALKSAAIFALIFCLLFVFMQNPPGVIAKKIGNIIGTNTASTAPAASSSNGRTFTIALRPKEKYDVDKVKRGQQWSFPTFTGQFQSRVDIGDDNACWETVKNTLPWKAEQDGTLQIRTEQAGVTVTANVQK